MTTSNDPVRDALRQAAARWPSVDFESAGLDSELRAHGPAKHLDDLCLAMAAGRGIPRAAEALQETYADRVDRSLSKSGLGGDDRVEARQRLWSRLLTDQPDNPAKITLYAGSGPLSAWLGVCAAREAIDMIRARRGQADSLRALTEHVLVASAPNLESVLARHEARDAVHSAIRASLERLPPRLSNVLRHRFLDGSTSSEIAVLYGVHRSTVDRWLNEARSAVIDGTRARLRTTLGVEADIARSLIRLVMSQLEVSISAALGPDEAT